MLTILYGRFEELQEHWIRSALIHLDGLIFGQNPTLHAIGEDGLATRKRANNQHLKSDWLEPWATNAKSQTVHFLDEA